MGCEKNFDLNCDFDGDDEGIQFFVTKAGAMEAEEEAALNIGLSLSPPSSAALDIGLSLSPPSSAALDIGLSLSPLSSSALDIGLSLSPPSSAALNIGFSLSPPSSAALPSSSSLVVVDKTSNAYHSTKMNKLRKQRRCWSPELHRRFINALLKLGGAQAAKPKQIRQIMNVDGLTNDEVKSHLQKYRLHDRRVTVSPPSSWPQPYYHVCNSLVMKVGTGAHSSSPETPLHLGLPVTREVSVTVAGLNAAAVEESERSVRGF